MTPQNFYNSIQAYARRISVSCEKLRPHYKPGRVHDLRTTFKKLRALLRWQGQEMEKKAFKKRVKKLYRAAGDLRNMQVLLKDMHSKKTILPQFTGWLKEKLDQSKKKWKKIYREKTTRRLEKNLPGPGSEILHRRWFFTRKIRELQLILQTPSINDEALHEARKILKDLQYVIEWCQKNKLVMPDISLEQVKENGKIAGDYHDQCTAIELIETYIGQEKEAPAATAARRVRRQWMRQKAAQKKSLLQSLSLLAFPKKHSLQKNNGQIQIIKPLSLPFSHN
jgi:CHAD domain-containing protein